MAFRAGNGTGKVWKYSLADLAEGSGGSKPHVQRGLTLFASEGLITVKRHGPKASEYTLHFEIDPSKELSP